MKSVSMFLVIFALVFNFGCSGSGGSTDGGGKLTNNDTAPKPNPPDVSQDPIAITSANAVDLARRAYIGIAGNYFFSELKMGNEDYQQKQGETTESCQSSGTRTIRWNVASTGYAREPGDEITFESNACADQAGTKTYGATTTTVNSSYDAQVESGSSVCNTGTCVINQTIDIVDFVTIDSKTNIGINTTLTKDLTVKDTGEKTLTMASDLITAGATDSNEGSEISNYSASSSYDPSTSEYTGTASLTAALSTPKGKIDITGSYTSDHDCWLLLQAGTASSVNMTITVTGAKTGATNSSVTVEGLDNTFSIYVDADGDGNADSAPTVLSALEFFTGQAAP